MADFILVPYPDSPGTAIRSIEASVERTGDGAIQLEFCARGVIDDVRWPEWKRVEPADRLWEHSCFEAFVGAVDAPGYVEFNFTTSGQWAAYTFDDYRAGMRPLEDALAAGGRTFGHGEVRIRRTFRLPKAVAAADWRLGLSAIIEAAGGGKSYWALAHPAAKPDFHDGICFAARLAAPAGS